MPAIKTKIKTDSPEYGKNDTANRKLAAELREALAKVAAGGSERSRS